MYKVRAYIKEMKNLNFLERIFSINNEYNNNIKSKVITILGIKIKLKVNMTDEIKNICFELENKYKILTSELKQQITEQNKNIFDLTQLICRLRNCYSKQEVDIDDVFSNYSVMSSIIFDSLNFLFDKPEFLQEFNNIKKNPKYALIWGSAEWKPQTETVIYAMNQNIPLLKLEDGFLRSADTYANKNANKKYTRGISFTISDSVHYFDATTESRLEKMINNRNLVITEEQKQRARKCIDRIIETHLTKYNHQPIYVPKIGRDGVKKVLVVDQSYGDFSISRGLADNNTFKTMLESAILENPDADIIVKTHPDTMVGTGGYYKGLKAHDNIYTQTKPINPISLIKYVDKVYVCTTQFGFEALMAGKEVHTFGMPFYAGWGLTIDAQKCERRTNKRTLEEVFYIAYIMYSYYVNPDKKCRCEIEDAMDYLLKLREEYFKENK